MRTNNTAKDALKWTSDINKPSGRPKKKKKMNQKFEKRPSILLEVDDPKAKTKGK